MCDKFLLTNDYYVDCTLRKFYLRKKYIIPVWQNAWILCSQGEEHAMQKNVLILYVLPNFFSVSFIDYFIDIFNL